MGPILSTSVLEILRAVRLIMARMSNATPTALANRTVKQKMSSRVTKGTLRSIHPSYIFWMITVGPLTFGLWMRSVEHAISSWYW